MGRFKIVMMVVISINVGWRQLEIFRSDLEDNDNKDEHFVEDAEMMTNHDDLTHQVFPERRQNWGRPQ